MQLGPQDGEDFLQAAERLEEQPSIHGARKRVRGTEVLVVDEISMMAGRHLDPTCNPSEPPMRSLRLGFVRIQ